MGASSHLLRLSVDGSDAPNMPTEPRAGVYRYTIPGRSTPGNLALVLTLGGVQKATGTLKVVAGPPSRVTSRASWTSYLYDKGASGVLVAPLGVDSTLNVSIADSAGNPLTSNGDVAAVAVSLHVVTAGGATRSAAAYEATLSDPTGPTNGYFTYKVKPLVAG